MLPEPRKAYRDILADKYKIPESSITESWEELVKKPKFADAVIIATQDKMHLEPALAFAKKGYHILLEKPMAPSAEDCRKIVKAAKANNIIFAVCHVMRYTAYTQAFKKILDSGIIGDIVSMQHYEPVGTGIRHILL